MVLISMLEFNFDYALQNQEWQLNLLYLEGLISMA
jgi:hypothetical protein